MNTTTKFLLTSNPHNLILALAGFDHTATVEAEYGDVVVEGRPYTLAHHGSRSANPAPCLLENQDDPDPIEAIGLSHLDLDALGGCLALQGLKPGGASFWELAAFVDINGAHKLALSGTSAEDLRALHAWWAWSEDHRVYAPRDGGVLDVSREVENAAVALNTILGGGEDLLRAGDIWKKTQENLNADTFVDTAGAKVAIRVSSRFCNHLYCGPDGTVYEAVVSLNPRTGAVTVSFADTPKGAGAVDVVQGLWGMEAGGHRGIAGSPRDRRMSILDLMEAAVATAHALL